MDIWYTTKLKRKEDIYNLYEKLGWNSFLKLSEERLLKAMEQSWYVIYAYDKELLVGTGRVISDGMTNAYLCGLGVAPSHRNIGIGTEIMKRLVWASKEKGLHIQLMCEGKLVPYYEKMAFQSFTVGMKLKYNNL